MNRNMLGYIAIFMLYFANTSLCMEEYEDLQQRMKEIERKNQKMIEEHGSIFRLQVMNIIKSIDQSAYDAIAKNDPMGTEHIRFEAIEYNGWVEPSPIDGLPQITLNPLFLAYSKDAQRFLIAHELAHYIMDDFTELYKNSYQTEEDYDLFNNAYLRAQENEADRIAILQFRISVDAGIAFGKQVIAVEGQLKHPEKETFKSSHPLMVARIQYFDGELRREAEIQRTPPKNINWEDFAQMYLKRYFGQ